MSKKLFYSLALAASVPVFQAGCVTKNLSGDTPPPPSLMSKMTSGVKSGTSKIASVFTPGKSAPADTNPPPTGKPGPGVFVAIAQINERNGNFDEAEAQYNKALDVNGSHLPALIGLAHLEDRRDHLESATKLYQKAAKKHPKESSVHNDLGLCYHRRGMLKDAGRSLERAVELKPDNKLYRDNLAAVYVDQDKLDNALVQLTAAHGPAVGNYNLGYLLTQKQNPAVALTYFRKAAEIDPSLMAARQWIAKLSPAEAPIAMQPGMQFVSRGVEVAQRPVRIPATQVDSNATFADRADARYGDTMRASNVAPTTPAAPYGAPAR